MLGLMRESREGSGHGQGGVPMCKRGLGQSPSGVRGGAPRKKFRDFHFVSWIFKQLSKSDQMAPDLELSRQTLMQTLRLLLHVDGSLDSCSWTSDTVNAC